MRCFVRVRGRRGTMNDAVTIVAGMAAAKSA
jgi:hypothetical protein